MASLTEQAILYCSYEASEPESTDLVFVRKRMSSSEIVWVIYAVSALL